MYLEIPLNRHSNASTHPGFLPGGRGEAMFCPLSIGCKHLIYSNLFEGNIENATVAQSNSSELNPSYKGGWGKKNHKFKAYWTIGRVQGQPR